MRVKVTEPCFTAGGIRRRVGDEFDFDGEVLPPHFVPVKPDVKPEPAKPKTQKPATLSEVGDEGKAKSFIESVRK